MGVVLAERHQKLSLGGVSGTFLAEGQGANAGEERVIRLKPGVLLFEDIPVGANVRAHVTRDHHLLDAGEGASPATVVVSSGGRTLTFADANPDTITASSGSFITDGYQPGMLVQVQGTTSNDGVFLIAAVTATVLTLAPFETLTAEGPLGGGETLAGFIAQPYRFELAPFPDLSNQVGGSNSVVRSLKRIIAPGPGVGGSGSSVRQSTPTFAPFSPRQDGALRQSGRAEHTLDLPGPSLAPLERNILRCRWVGTPVVGATIFTAAGGTLLTDITWNAHRRLVPGSIRITLPTSALHLRDDGKGRLVTESGEAFAGDGVVDYESGAFRIEAGVVETGAVTADYEHDCAYTQLDVQLAWDARLQ